MSKVHGQVYIPGLPDPSECYVTGEGLKNALVGDRCTVVLQTISFEGKPCEEPIGVLSCELVSEATGARISCTVERSEESQYEISYQPTIKGRHLIHIKAEGQHVRGSPFSLAVKSPIAKLGIPFYSIPKIVGPHGLVINQSGEVLVTDRIFTLCVCVYYTWREVTFVW